MSSNRRRWLLVALTVTAKLSVVLIAHLTVAAMRISQIFSLCLVTEHTGCGISPVGASLALGSWLTVVGVWLCAIRFTQREVMMDAVIEVVLFVLPQIVMVSASIVLVNEVSLFQLSFWKEPIIFLIVAIQVGASVLLVRFTQGLLLRRSASGGQD